MKHLQKTIYSIINKHKDHYSKMATKLANLPASIESLPNPGPTDLSSSIVNGTGNAPALNTRAKSLDS